MKHLKPFLFSFTALLALVMSLSACQTGDADVTEIPEYVIRAKDFSFETPAELPAGRAWIRLENEGTEIHHAQLLRLNDGVTVEQFMTALTEQGEAALALTTMPGGVGVLSPGGEGRVLLDLAEGQYVLACFLPSPDGVPHLAKGMIVPLRVTAGEGAVASEPEAAVTAMLKDFAVELPAEIPAGPQMWKVTNEGPQPHEVMILKLAEGKTQADVIAFMGNPQGVPPFEWKGGMQGLTTGQSGWLELDLTPGNYVAFCQIPDPASGAPHHALGMISSFSVQ